MHYYKAIIQYDGTNYFGFQWQLGIPSIQNDLNLSLSKLLRGKITTLGASRTDSGVHAVEQIVKITSQNEINCHNFAVELNSVLPDQIRCIDIVSCEGSFNPIMNSSSKEYRYLFTNQLQQACLEQRFIANNPYEINIELMKKTAKLIEGIHDFHNFCSAGSNVKTTVREIIACDLTEINPHDVLPQNELFSLPVDLRHCYQLRIEGKGFVKQMVRHLMSALWLVGGGRITADEFASYLEGVKAPKQLWKVASPRGLYLFKFHGK